MDQNQSPAVTPTPAAVVTSSAVPPATAVTSVTPVAGQPMEKDIKSKLRGIKIPKKLIIMLLVIVILLIVLSVVLAVSKNKRPTPTATPTPATSPTPTPVADLPSQYADDPDVADIKARMDALDRSLDEASFRDDTLRVPTLDFDVKF